MSQIWSGSVRAKLQYVVGLLAVFWLYQMAAAAPSLGPALAKPYDSGTLVEIPDVALRNAVKVALGKAPEEPINRGEMATLEILRITGVRQLAGIEYAVNLRSLSVFDGAIVDVSPLAALTSLTELRLGGHGIADLTPLAELSSLTVLWLNKNTIVDLSPLVDLTSLISLRLDDNAIVDVSPLAGLTSLSFLSLLNNEISGLAPLAHLDTLTMLNLGGNAVTDVSPLAGLTALTTLNLGGNAITDVSPLARLTALTELTLHRNSISDVSPLAGMTALTYLWLGSNSISDASPLAGLTALTTLNLGANAITDVSPLAEMTALTRLYVHWNSIADVSPLARLTALTELRAARNLISDVSPLARMTALTTLDLSSNSISNVAPLAGMVALTDLSLDNNFIMDVSTLAGMTTLLELGLDNTLISDVSSLAGMTALVKLRLGNNLIADISPLAGMTRLTELRIQSSSISDVSTLSGLLSLTRLDLRWNVIWDVSPIAANEGLGHGDSVDLRGNPLRSTSKEEHIPALLQRGVDVLFDAFETPQLPRIPDVGLREAAETALLHVLSADVFSELEALDASNRGISDLTGIGAGVRIRTLNLDRNRITDVTPLLELTSLRVLTLSYNAVEDWTPLAQLKNLSQLALDGNALNELPVLPQLNGVGRLYLTNNSISDISSLANLSLRELQLTRNLVTSLAPLAGMGHLEYLHVGDNQIADLSPLNLGALRELHMRNNAVRDIAPLLNGKELLMVDARRNPLGDNALTVFETLRERGVIVLAGETVPYFPAASGAHEGFVRIVNRSNQNGHVFIEAVDDAGVRAGPVRLRVLRRRAIHFDSADLEHGMAARRLDGIGPPTAGDWRLSVLSALDIEVLSYIRTEDGFLTAMHDVVPDAMAPFFNPGDARQRSVLRTVNMEAEPAKWTTGGYDDRGRWRPMAGSMLVRPQHALTLTGEALEDMHGLGDGDGRWRLRVRGFPWFAMSLVENPTGHLTNLSTVPDNATPLADGRTMHRLPLFPVADGSREGIVRVINRSYSSGEVTIEAVDDAGARSGPVQVAVAPRRAVELSATDLEHGNGEKGLAGRLGMGEGDWRLEVASELELTVLSYVQTADGFLASLHDVAPVAQDGGHRVVFFKPGSNRWQVSKLRLVNDGERAASVRIAGIDDKGVDSGPVTLTAPAGSALTFTSAELEAGSERLAGSLGDGYGQWRLRVHSDEPIAVMSLLETSGGLLANMSTGTAD